MKKIKFYFLFSFFCLFFANLANAQETVEFVYENDKGEKIYYQKYLVGSPDFWQDLRNEDRWFYSSKNTRTTPLILGVTKTRENAHTLSLNGQYYYFQFYYSKGTFCPIKLEEFDPNGIKASSFFYKK